MHQKAFDFFHLLLLLLNQERNPLPLSTSGHFPRVGATSQNLSGQSKSHVSVTKVSSMRESKFNMQSDKKTTKGTQETPQKNPTLHT